MRSAFLAREVLFTPSAEAIATNCSRSFDSSTDCSRASAATGSNFPRNVPNRDEGLCGRDARRAQAQPTLIDPPTATRDSHSHGSASEMVAGRIGKCGSGFRATRTLHITSAEMQPPRQIAALAKLGASPTQLVSGRLPARQTSERQRDRSQPDSCALCDRADRRGALVTVAAHRSRQTPHRGTWRDALLPM